MIKNLSTKLKAIRGDMSVPEFAKSLGVTKHYIYTIESGKFSNVSGTFIELLCEKYRISKKWLFDDEGDMYDQSKPVPIEKTNLTAVPIVNTIPAGYPEKNVESMEYMALPDIPAGAKMSKVKGNSMSPGIKSGDFIIWVTQEEYRHNDIVVVMDEFNDIMVKRLKIRGEEMYLAADNPEYQMFRLGAYHRIVGKVIKVLSIKNAEEIQP